MTRYARAGKGTHQRVAKDSTPWDELKPSEPERRRSSKTGEGKPSKNFKKERFSKQKATQENSSQVTEGSSKSNGAFNKSNNSKIRGFGQSKSIQIFGQFWVPLEDAKRIKNLLKKLKAQGLPRKEILEALKNDRRKAEKASKRQRDKTCFLCRQFGHILSDCPNVKKAVALPGLETETEDTVSADISSEICFKCGSTEHTSRKCRRKGENFSFAKCFICSGTGHIARQCPQNKNGIYPSGGSCSECGSTTHLKKDCPDLVGAEMDNSQSNTSGDVTLRVADPFSSTEYEPELQLDNKNATDGELENEEIKTFSKPSTKRGKPTKRKQKEMNSELDSSAFEFGLTSAPTRAAPPAKRKVVKF